MSCHTWWWGECQRTTSGSWFSPFPGDSGAGTQVVRLVQQVLLVAEPSILPRLQAFLRCTFILLCVYVRV